MTRIEQAAEFLHDLRQKREIVSRLPDNVRPRDAAEGYEVQQALVERLKTDGNGTVVGYKVACTSQAAQQMLGVDGPFYGRILSHLVYESPARLKRSAFAQALTEPEFAFRLKADVPVTSEPYTAETIRPFLGELIPVFEIVDYHYHDFAEAGGPSLVANNALLGAAIFGRPIADWEHIDLVNHQIRLSVNGEPFSEGTGAAALGSPLTVMAWLANRLHAADVTIKASQRVMTGTVTDVRRVVAGDVIEADYGELGSISVSFE